jgi:murein DD-endopeptidase MepM/ murein hydrolase activator NlpD
MARFSEFIQHPRMVRLRRRLHAGSLPSPTALADAAPSELPPEASVSQEFEIESFAPLVLTRTPRLKRLLPLTVRVSFLGMVAVALWWSWPRAGVPDFTLASQEETRAQSPGSLAIVNPANIGRATGVLTAAQAAPDATEVAWFDSIVVVTPTSPVLRALPAETEAPDDAPAAVPVVGTPSDEEIQLAASGVVTASEPVLIAVEIPRAGEAGAPATPQSGPRLFPAVESKPLAGRPTGIQAELVLLPTATPTQTPIPEGAGRLQVPKVEIVPALGLKLSPTPAAPTATPLPVATPTATPLAIGPGRLWSTFAPRPAPENDHFWIANPFADFASNRFASPNYQFGSTAGSRYRPHHGVDISNPLGTPVKAGVAGEVVHAGPDDPELLGPYPNFYGKAVVIRLDRRLPVAGGEVDVFVLYGHLSEVHVPVGQRVQPADLIGLVGMTGIAIGPHLHVEMRLGANTYDHSVNPYLWMEPAPGNGTVAVRLLTADGRTWAGAKVSIARFEGGKAVWARQIETYMDTENIGPDPAWGENGAMGDVPAGYYYLIGNVNGEALRAEFTVTAGQTTFVELRTQK